jgi:hypothetical protein
LSAGILPALMCAGFQPAEYFFCNTHAGKYRRTFMPAEAGAHLLQELAASHPIHFLASIADFFDAVE